MENAVRSRLLSFITTKEPNCVFDTELMVSLTLHCLHCVITVKTSYIIRDEFVLRHIVSFIFNLTSEKLRKSVKTVKLGGNFIYTYEFFSVF